MTVIIGMDPHKSSATIEVVDDRGRILAAGCYGTDKAGYAAMLAAGRRYRERTWAVEGCKGIGKHIAHRLAHDGETVLDVPAKLSAQVRVFATGNGRKSDPVDAHSVAMVALHTPNLVPVRLDADLQVMGMLVDRRDELGRARTQAINRLHQVLARGCTLMGLHGIGPAGAARLLADVGDIGRFADRDRFASWNGTAPLDASSGAQQRHRLSRAGNRRINRTLHIMAVVQLRHHTEGRAYFDAKKAAGKTSMEAMRALKRRLSNVVYARMVTDQNRRQAAGGRPGRALGDDSAIQRDRPDPGRRLFGQATSQTRHQAAYPAPDRGLDIKGCHDRASIMKLSSAGVAGSMRLLPRW